jgi:DnaJ-domain-containing protein 1
MGEMSDKAVQARREYAKKWREANPDKVKAAQKRYWEKKAKDLQQEEKIDLSGVKDEHKTK